MAQHVEALSACPEDLSLILSTDIGQLITEYNSSSKGSDSPFWPSCVCVHAGTHTQINKRNIFLKELAREKSRASWTERTKSARELSHCGTPTGSKSRLSSLDC